MPVLRNCCVCIAQFIESCGASGAALDLSGFDLRNVGALAGACLTMLTARHAVFYGLDLSGPGLQAARCAEADFRDCRFDGADMRGIVLSGALLNGASMQGAKLRALVIDARAKCRRTCRAPTCAMPICAAQTCAG